MSLKPAILSGYLRQLERLEAVAADPEGAEEVKRVVRALVEKVTVRPPSNRGEAFTIEVEGHLSSLLGEAPSRRRVGRGQRW